MKSIGYSRTGPSSVLTLRDKDIIAPAAGELGVRMIVSGVNPTDWKSRLGSGSSAELGHIQVPNQDGAGIVTAVGPGVTSHAIGDRVWLWDAAWERTEGTAQEYAVVRADRTVALPDAESFDTGASLGIPALTAHHALTAHGSGPDELTPAALSGKSVLVTGGAGAVSHAAIQLARWAGARVVTTVSGPEKADLAAAAGAQHILNYRTEDVAARIGEILPNGVDIIVEVAPGENLAVALDVIAPGGVIAIYVSPGEDPLPIPIRPSMVKNIRYEFILTYTVSAARKAAAVAAVSAALGDGALRVGAEYGLPLTRFPLPDTAAAQDAVQAGAVGKVLIDITPA